MMYVLYNEVQELIKERWVTQMGQVTLRQSMEQLREQKRSWNTFRVQRKEFKVVNSGSTVAIQEKEFPLLPTGKTTMCKTLGIPKSYFNRYPIETEIAEHSNTMLNLLPEAEVLVRTNGDSVVAVLPTNYAVYDNWQFFESMLENENKLGAYKMSSNRSSSVNDVFTITFGEPKNKADEIYPMLRFSNSEVGMGNLTVEMGLFRLVCSNGAVRKARDYGYFNWGHNMRSLNKVNTFIGISLDLGLQKSEQLATKMEQAREEKLTLPTADIVGRLVERNWLSTVFAKKILAENEAIPIVTKFELVNAITRKAQDERNWGSQVRYEDVATKLLEMAI